MTNYDLSQQEAGVAAAYGEHDRFYTVVELRECMACMHNFEPDTVADSSCPYCGGPSEALHPIVALASVEPPDTVLPYKEPVGECPTCKGESAEPFYGDPAYSPHCPTCAAEGHVDIGSAQWSRVRLQECALCGDDIEPIEGYRVGVAQLHNGTGLCCGQCLGDPENKDALYGVIFLGDHGEIHAGRRHHWETRV